MQNDNLYNHHNVHVFYDDARQGIVSLLKITTHLYQNVAPTREGLFIETMGIVP
ncbi:MAG: hypothetical protein ACI4SL_10675 [Candidatus Ornithospirochaeta sp.]